MCRAEDISKLWLRTGLSSLSCRQPHGGHECSLFSFPGKSDNCLDRHLKQDQDEVKFVTLRYVIRLASLSCNPVLRRYRCFSNKEKLRLVPAVNPGKCQSSEKLVSCKRALRRFLSSHCAHLTAHNNMRFTCGRHHARVEIMAVSSNHIMERPSGQWARSFKNCIVCAEIDIAPFYTTDAWCVWTHPFVCSVMRLV